MYVSSGSFGASFFLHLNVEMRASSQRLSYDSFRLKGEAMQPSTETHRPDGSLSVVVVGSGYVGLVAALCLAEMGHRVQCVDKDPEKIAALQEGRAPIHEEFLPELLARHGNRTVTFTSDLAQATRQAQIIFIAVGTPQTRGGKTNLSSIEAAVAEIARNLTAYTVIVGKSTVPVYTNDWIGSLVRSCGVGPENFDVVSNPEFLREGSAVTDFLHPDRIVAGCSNDRSAAVVEQVYRPLTGGSYYRRLDAIPGERSAGSPPILLRTSPQSAELIKHSSNAFLAMKVSFINAIANLCEAVGANIAEVGPAIGMDKRIGTEFLHPGIGYGGSCFPKDLAAFRSVAAEHGVDFSLLGATERINQLQPLRFLEKVRNALGDLGDKKLGVLGLAYKGGTDDIRESPAMRLMKLLLAEGATLAAFDPAAMDRARTALPETSHLRYARNEMDAAEKADALLVLTDWPQFAALDLETIAERMRPSASPPLLIDGRNLYQPEQVTRQKMTYLSIGRPVPELRADDSEGLEIRKSRSSANSPGIVRSSRKRQRVLLTGAAGFLGSHLADRLLAEGHHVLGVDDLSTGDVRNIAHLNRERRFELIEQDSCEFFDPGPIDFLFNFASPASPPQYLRRGIPTLRVGSVGTMNMLDLAVKYGAKFLHASTSECYGTPEIHPQPESYWGHVNPIGPRSVYDESKRFGEAAVMAYRERHRVDTRLVRIFNTYGPRMMPDDGRVISNFIMQALRAEDVTIYGDGSHTRSFCYVTDLVEGILRLSKIEEALPVNLGNPTEETVLGCARRIIALIGSQSKLRFETLPVDDPPRRQPDITKARQLLGWEPVVSLDEGLKQTIAYFRRLKDTCTPAATDEVRSAPTSPAFVSNL
jgi:UDPglucose 6-dehydrogenase